MKKSELKQMLKAMSKANKELYNSRESLDNTYKATFSALAAERKIYNNLVDTVLQDTPFVHIDEYVKAKAFFSGVRKPKCQAENSVSRIVIRRIG
jgi:hypothetical protein